MHFLDGSRKTVFCELALLSLFGLTIGCGGDGKYKQVPSSTSVEEVGGEGNSTSAGSGGLSDQEAFGKTVFPLVRSVTCKECHSISGKVSPYFADENLETAFNNLITAKKVDLTNPAKSRLYLRLQADGHKCWTESCENDAAQMLTKIEEWKTLLTDQVGDSSALTKTDELYYGDRVEVETEGPALVAFEAESGTRQGVFALANSANASGGVTVSIPATAGVFNTPNQNPSILRVSVEVPSAKNYRLWTRVSAGAAASDTVFVRVDANPFATWTFQGASANFSWQKLNIAGQGERLFNLAAGMHVVEFRHREANMTLDSVMLLEESITSPDQDQTIVNNVLKFPLSGILGVSEQIYLQVEVETYDDFSYVIKNPSIISVTSRVQVKSLKFLINNHRDPTLVTFELVDKIVSPADPYVSKAALIAPIDQGVELDSFAFEFGEIKIVP